MSKIEVYKKDGKKSGSVELNEKIYGARINHRLLDEIVRLFANNKRAGTSSTKTFGEVSGGGRKPWKQKGTGRARTSSIRNPIFRGGGTVFGPRPRKILNFIPQKMRQKALISALSLKNKEGNIRVVEDAKVANPKTKEFFSMIKSLELNKGSVLCVVENLDETIKRASRNIPKLQVKSAEEFNAYHVMRNQKLLLEKGVTEKIENRLKETIK